MRAAAWIVTYLQLLNNLATPHREEAGSQRPLLKDAFRKPAENASYDYVVVGGGTAGLAIAYRLAESGSETVAVVEAGGFYEMENGNVSVVPAYNQEYAYITPDSRWKTASVDWGFLTTPQAGANGQVFHYGRGKMLGGCSAENTMNYNLPTVGTLQAWADAVNDSSYTWDAFRPYFTRSVTYTNPNTSIRAANATVPNMPSSNSTQGPLQVSHPNWASPIASWAQLAFREMGIEDVHDLISGELIGSQYNALTINPRDQSRSSSQSSFLDQALESNLNNLQVYIHTMAKRILFDDSRSTRGVEVQDSSSTQSFTLFANKEIIVSAGAFQSPQLLMVSGIGPRKTLEEHAIEVVADLPGVGQNMWDHAVTSVGYQVNVETYGQMLDKNFAAHARAEYNINHTGLLTNDMSDYLGWEKLPSASRAHLSASTLDGLSQFPDDWPEIEHMIVSAPFGTPSYSTVENPIDVAYIQPVLLAPFSRGNITISSADMMDPPIINPNWLTHPSDQEVAIAALKRGRQFFNTTAIAPALIGHELLPGPDLRLDSSDEETLAWLHANIGFNWHASCTCKMGTPGDPMAVVDSAAKVFGVKGLRVVDASALPLLPPGHPQATIYALAEKIADDILNGR